MLIQRIKLLWNVLGCTNKEIAAVFDCSVSHISKICSGKRELREGGDAALHFAQAIITFAENTDRTQVLCKVCDLEPACLTAQALSAWLFGDGRVMSASLSDTVNEDEKKKKDFSKNLNDLMELLELNNARLSRTLNVDASLISRYRNGRRMPQKNSPLTEMMCSLFVNRMQAMQFTKEVALLTHIEEELLSSEKAAQHLQEWMLASAAGNMSVTRTIDYLRMFMPMTQLPSDELLEKIRKVVDSKKQETYWGLDGMRDAAIRLMSEAAAEGGGEVLLYADQSLQWLLEDEATLQAWYMCCAMCISRNVRIVVIHDVNRKVDDMASAMQVWVPLFMTGTVSPYYCPLNRGSRFYHMLFLRPNRSAISSVQVQGSDSNNFYDYITDPRKLSALHTEFRTLIAHSEQLIRVYSEDSLQNYYDSLLAGMRKTGNSIALLSAPSTVTMPEEVLKRILDRGQVDQSAQALILETRQCTREVLERGRITELFSLPDMQVVREGKWRIRIGDALDSGNVFYTEEEFRAHIREIIRLIRTYPNYRCCLIGESPFKGLRMIITEDRAVVIRLHEPYMAFVVSNVFFAKAFAKHLSDYYEQSVIPRDKLIDYLERYLSE